MIQKHTILINLAFSGNAETFVASGSSMTTFGSYQINNVQGIGGGIVNPSNVRAFLNDDAANQFIINDFFSYLTGSTTTIEFAEIYNSDQKLSDTFNDYYNSSILNNQLPGTSVINSNLTGTTGITVVENAIYDYDGTAPAKGLTGVTMSINNSTRKLNIYSALTTYTEEESYYIPVFIKRNSKQMARLYFEACDKSESLVLNLPLGDGGLNDGSVPIKPGLDDLLEPILPIQDGREPSDDSQNEEPVDGPAINVGNFSIISR